MNPLKVVFISLLILIILADLSFKASLASAAGVCGGYFYGGPCVVSEILVDKLVKDPSSGNFVDNLGPTDSKFNSEDEVIFKIIIKNTGSTDIPQINVEDVLPNYLNFVSGPEGTNWNAESRTFEFKVENLKAGESKEFEVKAKVVAKEDLPADKSLICVTNLVEVKAEDMSDLDTAGLCIQNVSILPPTGPEPLVMVAILVLGTTGLVLIRKTSLA